MPRHPVGRPVLALTAILVLLGGAPARAALNCPSPNATPIAPNDILGVVSRVETNPKIGRSIQYTVQPNLENLDLAEWMRNIEKAGANIAQINLQPIAVMAREQAISDSDWDAYIAAAFEPHERQGPEQRAAYKAMRDRIGARNGAAGITPDQQTKLLIAFLSRLEALKESGRICGNVQFIVGERRWFPVGRPWNDKFNNETMYARTVGNFINTAKSLGLDHWLAGVFFPEHTNTDMNQLLPITVGITARINGLTGNWLKSHLMVLAGGGFGNQFNGIDTVVCPDSDSRHPFSCKPGSPFDFFGLISEQTGTFAFAYKAFNWQTAPTPGQYCTARAATKCDPRQMSVADWTDYLGSSRGGLGFGDLAAFVNRNAARWPRAANVIFVGNSSDSLFRMVEVQPGPSGDHLVATPQLIALANLFQDAARGGGGWSGHFFMDPYGDTDRQVDPDHMSMDNGSYLFFVDYSPFDFQGNAAIHANPQTQAFWRAWPKLTPQSP
jgi:hypothetical protein